MKAFVQGVQVGLLLLARAALLLWHFVRRAAPRRAAPRVWPMLVAAARVAPVAQTAAVWAGLASVLSGPPLALAATVWLLAGW